MLLCLLLQFHQTKEKLFTSTNTDPFQTLIVCANYSDITFNQTAFPTEWVIGCYVLDHFFARYSRQIFVRANIQSVYRAVSGLV